MIFSTLCSAKLLLCKGGNLIVEEVEAVISKLAERENSMCIDEVRSEMYCVSVNVSV